MPRTMVRVPDDSRTAIGMGIEDDVYATILGTSTPRDLVVTDGPMIRVSETAGGMSVIGRTLTAGGGEVTLVLSATSAEWVGIDTLEVFVNSTYDPLVRGVSALQPFKCYTSRTLAANDPCMTAALPAEGLSVSSNQGMREASVVLTLSASQVAAANRAGALGVDAWVVVRVTGERPVFPVLTQSLDPQNLAAVVAAGTDNALAAALGTSGIPSMAFTGPIFVDYDGGGWRAPFAP